MTSILCKDARTAMIIAVLMLAAAGCVRNPHFEVMNFSAGSGVPSDDNLPVAYSVSVSLDYPAVKGDTTHVVTAYRHAIVANALGWQFDTLDVQTAVQVYVDSLTADFNLLAADMKSAGMYDDGVEPSEWFDSIVGYFAGSSKRFSSYVIECSGYSGGAHPESGTIGIVYDLQGNRQVTLDDLFITGFDDILGDLISLHAEECLPEGAAEALFSSRIMPTGNFVLTGRSITFIYNPYEIGPYSLGVVQISVPLKECRAAGILAVKL